MHLALGLIGTTIYILLIGNYFNWSVESVSFNGANELGDFLAGVFAPLAFLWLVVGYFMQASELKQTTKALELQTKEMNLSVKEQEKLAKASEEQLAYLVKQDLEKAQTSIHINRPVPHVTYIKEQKTPSDTFHYEISINNIGEYAGIISSPDTFGNKNITEVSFFTTDNKGYDLVKANPEEAIWPPQHRLEIRLTALTRLQSGEDWSLSFMMLDRLHRSASFDFEIVRSGDNKEVLVYYRPFTFGPSL